MFVRTPVCLLLPSPLRRTGTFHSVVSHGSRSVTWTRACTARCAVEPWSTSRDGGLPLQQVTPSQKAQSFEPEQAGPTALSLAKDHLLPLSSSDLVQGVQTGASSGFPGYGLLLFLGCCSDVGRIPRLLLCPPGSFPP